MRSKRRTKTKQPVMITLELRRDRHYLEAKSRRKGEPFFRAQAGVLFHRVRYITDFYVGKRLRHTAVTYQCNNTSFVRAGSMFSGNPTEQRAFVCSACEYWAKKRNKPTADQLAGKHVHVGRLVAVQLCCVKGTAS